MAKRVPVAVCRHSASSRHQPCFSRQPDGASPGQTGEAAEWRLGFTEPYRVVVFNCVVSVDERLLSRLDELITKADQVLATHKPNPPNVIGFPTLDSAAFTGWQAQSLAFLRSLLGDDHVYVERFRSNVDQGFQGSVEAGKGILAAVREDVALGYLLRVKALVAAEVFSDFVEMGEHLLDAGYKDPAASLAGAVLENGLRQIATEHGIKLKAKEDLSSLNSKCAQAGLYNRLTQKKLQVWTDVRNHADHGEFDQYTESDVRAMLAGVTDFLGTHLT